MGKEEMDLDEGRGVLVKADLQGEILYNDRGLFFIHSSGRFPYCVVKERLFLSRSVRFSKVKIIGKFSDSRRLIRKWLLRQRVY